MVELVCDAIIFDLDGVLVDSSIVVERHWRRWGEQHSVDYARIAAVMHGRRSAEVMALVAPHLDAEDESRDFEAHEAVDTEGLRVFDGAATLLPSLPPRKWGIATSGTALTAATRLRFGRLPVPAVLVTAEDVRRGKPDPDAYLLAARRLGVGTPSCVVVEDSPAGVAAAHAAGMRAIAVLTTHDRAALAGAELIVPGIDSLHIAAQSPRLVISARVTATSV